MTGAGREFQTARRIAKNIITQLVLILKPLNSRLGLHTAVRLQAKVRERELGPRPRLYAGPDCDDTAAEAAVVAQYKRTLPVNIFKLWLWYRYPNRWWQHTAASLGPTLDRGQVRLSSSRTVDPPVDSWTISLSQQCSSSTRSRLVCARCNSDVRVRSELRVIFYACFPALHFRSSVTVYTYSVSKIRKNYVYL